MKSTKNIKLSILMASVIALSGCQSTTKVKRLDSDTEFALTDKWNSTDSKLVAEAMIADMLAFPWYIEYQKQNKTKPVIIIQQVRNKSHEHIAMDTFLNDLKRAILRTGQAQFVANQEVRKDIRTERQDQELNASFETQNELAEETGADFALSGTINSMVDQLAGKRVTAYQIDLRLIDMTTNLEVWNGQKKLQKLQEQDRFGL